MGDQSVVSEIDASVEEVFTEQKARQLLAESRAVKLRAFQDDLNAVCRKHRGEIVAIPQLTPDGRIGAQAIARLLEE